MNNKVKNNQDAQGFGEGAFASAEARGQAVEERTGSIDGQARDLSDGGGERNYRPPFLEKLKELPDRIASLWRTHRTGARAHAREGLLGAMLGVIAYLLGACELPFEVYPLGFALLCASPKRITWILVGPIASALSLGERSFIYIFAYATAIMLVVQ